MLKFASTLLTVSFLLLLCTQAVFSQIESDGEKISKKVKPQTEVDNFETELYVGMTPSFSSRVLQPNDGLFGKPLGERENEVGKWISSYGLGVRSALGENVGFEFGVGFNREKEFYSFEDVDTSYMYTSTYNYLNFPLKVSFFTPGRLSFYGAAGIAPKVFFQQKKEITFNNGTGFDTNEEEIIKDGFNTMMIDVVANAGIRYNATDIWGVYLLPEFRYQLNSSYDNQAPFKRNPYAFGIQFGLQFSL